MLLSSMELGAITLTKNGGEAGKNHPSAKGGSRRAGISGGFLEKSAHWQCACDFYRYCVPGASSDQG